MRRTARYALRTTGPSGAGYAFAEKIPGARAAPFAEATAELMAQAGLRLLNVIGSVPTSESLHQLTAQPHIDALLYWTFDNDYSGLSGNVAYYMPTTCIARTQSCCQR